MNYKECLGLVTQTVAELLAIPATTITLDMKIGGQFQAVSTLFSLNACTADTTIRQIADVLYEREVEAGH
ncbi:MAG: hypothetical protein EXS46_01685 [Candidatus Taylorbacteria bacterium]|nr:hypothetical protein [Candidatus Taylorbacteria bacterium]